MIRKTGATKKALLRRGFVASLAVGALALTACSGGGGGGGASTEGESVPYGAGPEEFAAALADMDPVTLVYNNGQNSETALGAPPAIAMQEYIEEYSGGKITIEMVWANSIVGPTEFDNALGDGRIDLTTVYPIYEPSEYGAGAVLNDITMLNPAGVLEGLLVGGGGILEYGFRQAAFSDEMGKAGAHMAIPLLPTSATYVLCSEPINGRADFAGKQIRVSGSAHADEFEALGAVAVSMPFTEIYEALQRGVVDCTTASFGTAVSTGLLEVAPWVHHSPEVAIPLATGAQAYSDKVASLPVAAQQIIFDAHYKYIEAYFHNELENIVGQSVQVVNDSSNGGFVEYDSQTVADLQAANVSIAEKLAGTSFFDGSGMVSELESLFDKWQGIYEELGYEGGSLDSVNEWYDPATLDLKPFFDRLYEEVLNEYRPGA